MRNPGGSNFAATNSRMRKAGTSSTHNTMVSFRSGPVKVMNDNNNNTNAQPKTFINGIRNQKDASKRPSSASKANKKTTKMTAKTSSRPSTASTRTNSNRPPSPGSRSLKSDLLFSSYNKNKNCKVNNGSKPRNTKAVSSSTSKIKGTMSNNMPKTRPKPSMAWGSGIPEPNNS